MRKLEGKQVYPVVNPRPSAQRFTMKNAQLFDRKPVWRDVMQGSTEEKKIAFSDATVRDQLRSEAVAGMGLPQDVLPIQWDKIRITRTILEENANLRGTSVGQMAIDQGKEVLDAFLDLVLGEDLNTGFENNQSGSDAGVMAQIIASPYTLIGLSDAGAHVVFEAGYGYSTLLLGHWVRSENAISLEEGIRKLTSMQASLYGLHDRGLIKVGMAADLVVFDPETVGPEEPHESYDLPGDLMRLGQRAVGVSYTIVNGQILLDHGEHTGSYPGRVLRNGASVRQGAPA